MTHNPELVGLNLKGFDRAASQLRKVTDELQDMVMSIRMVPIAGTFQSMQRIVRDMCRKLGKDITLNLTGEETEVDKNVIDLIADPLMHLIRNCIDHGIESPAERLALGKPEKGNIYLEARHESGEVCLTIRDDGHGLDRAKILAKARKSHLINDDGAGLSDKEVWSFILKAGFSTNEQVTEFSGRGVGMDVVMQNLEQIGGKLQIESETNQGTTFLIRIPLTLAIIDGMEIAVGNKRFTIPISMIREAFQQKNEAVILDSDQNELIMIRGRSHQIIRLHRTFKLETPVEDLHEGILIVLEHDTKAVCLFADRMLGEHQVVVKPIPPYIGQIEGVAGCSIMSDGTVSLILDINGLIERGASRP